MLQIVEPVTAAVVRPTNSGHCVVSKCSSTWVGEGRLLQQVRPLGHLGGNVIGNERLYINAILSVLDVQ